MIEERDWQRAERPSEDLMFSDERSLLQDAFSKAFSDTAEIQDQLRARDQLGYLRSSAAAYGEAMTGMMEQLLIRDGWADYARENGFWSAWAGFCAERGQPSNWLPPSKLQLGAPEAGADLGSWRADQAGPVVYGYLTMNQHTQLMQAAVSAAVKAIKSQPEVTSTEIAQLDDKGEIVKRSQVVTRRLSQDKTP